MTVAGITDIVDVCPHCASQCSDNPEYAVLRRTLKWRWCGPCGSLVEFVRLPEPMRVARQARLVSPSPHAPPVRPPLAPPPRGRFFTRS